MPLAAYPEVDALLHELMRGCCRILDPKLLGLYLCGSLVTGDFDLDVSDVDLVAITSEPVEGEDFEKLQAMHDEIARRFPSWNDRVETLYVSVAALGTFRSQRSRIVVISPGEPFHHVEAGMDWLMNWYMVRERGVCLYGAPAGELTGPISREEYMEAVREHARSYADWIGQMRSRPGQSYAILTLCRALFTLRTGEQPSKAKAARWAAEEFPEWAPLIQQALRWRHAWREEADSEATFPATVEFVRYATELVPNA